VTRRELAPHILSVQFGPSRLWLDDIVEIDSLLREITEITSIRMDIYQLDSASDLAGAPENRVKSIEWVGAGGDVVLRLHYLSCGRLTVVNPDLRSRGLATELQRYMQKRRKWPLPFAPNARNVGWLLVWCISVLGSLTLLDVPTTHVADRIRAISPWLLVAWDVALLAVIVLLAIYWRTMNLYTKTHSEAPRWIYRNRDALVTNAVVSAIFLVLGILIGRLTS
jgi:hypothetical protein